MECEVYDEAAADAQVIANLQNEIKRLRSKCMKFLTDKSGQLYKVQDDDAVPVTPDEIDKLLSDAKDEVSMLENAAASLAAASQNGSSSSANSADGSQTSTPSI